MESTLHQTRQTSRGPVAPLIAAIAFLGCYLAVDFAAAAVSTGSMPLPGDPAQDVHAYYSANTTASILTGALQGLSALGLALFVAGPATRAGRASDGHRRTVRLVGAVAVTAMLVSAALAIVSGATASSASVDTVVALRNAVFSTGGVLHVVALGLFVLIMSRYDGWTRPVRAMSWIGGVPAVLSVVSVFWFYGSPLLPLGRLLCMVALIAAGVSLLRGRTPAASA